jgi:hypothetical protein
MGKTNGGTGRATTSSKKLAKAARQAQKRQAAAEAQRRVVIEEAVAAALIERQLAADAAADAAGYTADSDTDSKIDEVDIAKSAVEDAEMTGGSVSGDGDFRPGTPHPREGVTGPSGAALVSSPDQWPAAGAATIVQQSPLMAAQPVAAGLGLFAAPAGPAGRPFVADVDEASMGAGPAGASGAAAVAAAAADRDTTPGGKEAELDDLERKIAADISTWLTKPDNEEAAKDIFNKHTGASGYMAGWAFGGGSWTQTHGTYIGEVGHHFDNGRLKAREACSNLLARCQETSDFGAAGVVCAASLGFRLITALAEECGYRSLTPEQITAIGCGVSVTYVAPNKVEDDEAAKAATFS